MKDIRWGMSDEQLSDILKGSTDDIYEALNILSSQLKAEYEDPEMEKEIQKFEEELQALHEKEKTDKINKELAEQEAKRKLEIEAKFAFLKKELDRIKNEKAHTVDNSIDDIDFSFDKKSTDKEFPFF